MAGDCQLPTCQLPRAIEAARAVAKGLGGEVLQSTGDSRCRVAIVSLKLHSSASQTNDIYPKGPRRGPAASASPFPSLCPFCPTFWLTYCLSECSPKVAVIKTNARQPQSTRQCLHLIALSTLPSIGA